jgi:tetratricopeptide (TPR) repeat protein
MIQYRYLRYTYGLTRDEIALNLAHCYFMLGDTANARKHYATLGKSASPTVRTVAYQQLGVLAFRHGKRDQAMGLFRAALVASPGNEGARYNYELVSELSGGHPADTTRRNLPTAPPPPPPDVPQQSGDDHSEPEDDGGSGTGSLPPATETAMSPERAEMLLKAIQSQESEYLRQRQEASSRHARSTYKGPDW